MSTMEIVEEVERRRQTLVIDDPGRAYAEIRDLLERRMRFDEVREEKYFNDVEEGKIRSKITIVEVMDNVTREELEVYLFIDEGSRELDIQVKGKLVTEYETEGWKNTLWYYAYRALYEKFLYGHVRHEYEPVVGDRIDELFERLRQTLEAET